MMTIEHSSAFMLHKRYATLKPNRGNYSEVTSAPGMETSCWTLSYVFGIDAWAVSLTSSFLPFRVCSTRCQAKTERDFVLVRHPYRAIVFILRLFNPTQQATKKAWQSGYQAIYDQIVDANIIDALTARNKYTNNLKLV